ncbi:MAG TPA: hypothetical protein DCY13_16895, partial [Verrucomicrobiales bacterium]|nr:hypothetical protein [Verrucomicrobiales bacterium]
MSGTMNKLTVFLATALLWTGAIPLHADEAASRHFTLKVLPLLKAKCFACHGDDPAKIKGDLNMLTREGLLKGGEYSQKVLVPGKAEESDLYIAVTWKNSDLEMPPKENDRLMPGQIEIVKAWINAGAPWPSEAEQKKHREAEWSIATTEDGVIIPTSGGLADEWTYRRYKPEEVWAFQPVKKPGVNKGMGTKESDSKQPTKNSSVPIPLSPSPIDAFVNAKLAKAGHQPAPPADPRTLIRRATFDLLGLPPKPEEIAAFEAAWKKDSAKAWSDLIDRLLASPHYGERQAQHWFDVTRYADTGGMANDFERSNMWRYRDWVIRAFNDDKPYDRFVMEQIAGDQLADRAALERLG